MKKLAEASGSPNLEKTLADLIAAFSQRSSTPRQILAEELSALASTGEGFTAEELWQRLKSSHEKIGRATVFRALKNLVESQAVDFVDFADGSRLYRVCGDRLGPEHGHHHHLACTRCHKILDFHYCLPEAALQDVGSANHFQIEGHTLTVFGVCEECQGL